MGAAKRACGLTRNELIASWALAALVAGALSWLGWFPKLAGDPYAIALFNSVASSDLVPLGSDALRLIVGGVELIVVVLVLIPATRAIGGVLAAGTMLGALASHVGTPLGVAGNLLVEGTERTIKGVEIPETNPVLFPIGIVVLLLGIALLFAHRRQIAAAARGADRAGDEEAQPAAG